MDSSPVLWGTKKRQVLKGCPAKITGESDMGDTATPIHHEATKEVGALTDGFHLVIDALKLNDITTIYNVPGIPITDLAVLCRLRGCGYSRSGTNKTRATPRPLLVS